MTDKTRIDDLAVFGGTPAFESPLPVGQLYLPDWTDFERLFRGIFARRYFTNHGPLVRELDERIAAYLGVRHATNVTNGTVALMIALRALDLRGEVIVPSFTFPATVQAISWAGLTPVFCDVDPATHMLTAENVRKLIGPRTSGVLGVHLWGRACDPDALQKLCLENNLRLLFDAAHAFSCTWNGHRIGGLGDVECFSLHATKLLSAMEGGCLTTNDDGLAARIRTIRNFHVSESFVQVSLRINGKMTEAQAGMALLSLDMLPAVLERNQCVFDIYSRYAQTWCGLRLLEAPLGETWNHQYCVLEVDARLAGLERDELLEVLRSEGVLARRYFYPGLHRLPPYFARPEHGNVLPVTDELCKTVMQLPLGARVSARDAERVGRLLGFVLEHGTEIRKRLQQRGAQS